MCHYHILFLVVRSFLYFNFLPVYILGIWYLKISTCTNIIILVYIQLNFDILNTDISSTMDISKWFVSPKHLFLKYLSTISIWISWSFLIVPSSSRLPGKKFDSNYYICINNWKIYEWKRERKREEIEAGLGFCWYLLAYAWWSKKYL